MAAPGARSDGALFGDGGPALEAQAGAGEHAAPPGARAAGGLPPTWVALLQELERWNRVRTSVQSRC